MEALYAEDFNTDLFRETKRIADQYHSEQLVSRDAQLYLESTGRRRGFADIYNYNLAPQR